LISAAGKKENKMFTFETYGEPGTTVSETGSDASQNLIADTSLSAQNAAGSNIVACLISVEDNDIRFSFTADAVQGAGSEVGHVLEEGQSIMLKGFNTIDEFEYINKTNGSNATLMLTPFYAD
jgi:hypothetical protein